MTLVLLGETPQIFHRVPEGEARSEATLRDLIAANPAILPLRDVDPGFGTIIPVTIELSIPGVGFVDVLLMDEFGRLIVVECKLWRNPQARREVVGQILDYARELSRFSYEDLQRQVSIATRRQGNVLYELAREAGCKISEADFVDRITRDLANGRFQLLVVGDGIAEGTRRIGEYLRDQPGLAFSFALIEIAEYRTLDSRGAAQTIMHPRIVAQTVLIERHIIRAEVPGLVIDSIQSTGSSNGSVAGSSPSEASLEWRKFAQRLIDEVKFDDPGQPVPRIGGVGWLRVPLPGAYYINIYRSSSEGGIGAQVRFPGVEGETIFSALHAKADEIAAEFAAVGLPAPIWGTDEIGSLSLTEVSEPPWDMAKEAEQREWMVKVANQFANSLRHRIERLV